MADVERSPEKPSSTIHSDTVSHDSVEQSGKTARETLFTGKFFDKDPDGSKARAAYLKIHSAGLLVVSVVIFVVFSIFWGALWKLPAHSLKGWIVDFDGSLIGQTVTHGFTSSNSFSRVTWEVRSPSDFPNGPSDVAKVVIGERCWVAVTINPGSTVRLNQSVANGDVSYDGSQAVTAYADEARQENGYRGIIRPTIENTMRVISREFTTRFAQQLASNPNISSLLSNAPQVVTLPLYYTISNLKPFDIPVASAITFVGLIYLLILSFMVTMISYNARLTSGLDRRLTYRSLVLVRIITPTLMYFFLSCMYSLLNLAFDLPYNRTFGKSGFVVYWMLSWCAMMALGFALEAMLTLVTTKFIPFFLLLWIIVNVSVCIYPIEVMPHIYRYGYSMPFYNVSRAVRTIVFGTRNEVGLNFGVLFAWIAISCMTLPLFQWLARRRM